MRVSCKKNDIFMPCSVPYSILSYMTETCLTITINDRDHGFHLCLAKSIVNCTYMF